MDKKPLNPEGGIAVFTDGSAYTKDRSGGWSWVAIDAFDGITWESDGCMNVTISQMELHAIGRAIYDIQYDLDEDGYDPQKYDLLVYSDSEYAIKGLQDKTRKRNVNHNDWKFAEQHIGNWCSVTFEHVKGHAGHEFNELADELAGTARRERVNGNTKAKGV